MGDNYIDCSAFTGHLEAHRHKSFANQLVGVNILMIDRFKDCSTNLVLALPEIRVLLPIADHRAFCCRKIIVARFPCFSLADKVAGKLSALHQHAPGAIIHIPPLSIRAETLLVATDTSGTFCYFKSCQPTRGPTHSSFLYFAPRFLSYHDVISPLPSTEHVSVSYGWEQPPQPIPKPTFKPSGSTCSSFYFASISMATWHLSLFG